MNRVVRVDLSGDATIDPLDESYFSYLLDRPDITLVIKGLSQGLTPHLWSEAYIRARIGNLLLHKLKCFSASEVTSNNGSSESTLNSESTSKIMKEVKEKDEFRSMTMNDYFEYLHRRDKDYEEVLEVKELGNTRKLKVGSRVRGRYHQRSTWFRGRITAVKPSLVTEEATEGPSTSLISEEATTTSSTPPTAAATISTATSTESVMKTEDEDEVCYDIKYDDGDVDSDMTSEYVLPCNDMEEMENTTHLRDGLYLIDFDITRHLPELHSDLEKKFKMDLLPRGKRCLLRYLTSQGHPFMGPNLYITPPGSFTQFHQDGHGTVDSGHQCLRGSNEVVMLRRMDEANKRRALRILCGNMHYDALYGLSLIHI